MNKSQHIPRNIFTIWLNDKQIPDLILGYIQSHRMQGSEWEHVLITLDNCNRDSKYVQACLSRNDVKGWVKASDYLRLWYLYRYGGIYIDAATEILKPFDNELLSNHLFACREDNGFTANGIIGIESHHPVVKNCLDRMEKYNGTDDLVFEYGMETWTKELARYGTYDAKPDDRGVIRNPDDPTKFAIYPMEYFLPYNHQTGVTNITPNSYTIHYYLKSWL